MRLGNLMKCLQLFVCQLECPFVVSSLLELHFICKMTSFHISFSSTSEKHGRLQSVYTGNNIDQELSINKQLEPMFSLVSPVWQWEQKHYHDWQGTYIAHWNITKHSHTVTGIPATNHSSLGRPWLDVSPLSVIFTTSNTSRSGQRMSCWYAVILTSGSSWEDRYSCNSTDL